MRGQENVSGTVTGNKNGIKAEKNHVTIKQRTNVKNKDAAERGCRGDWAKSRPHKKKSGKKKGGKKRHSHYRDWVFRGQFFANKICWVVWDRKVHPWTRVEKASKKKEWEAIQGRHNVFKGHKSQSTARQRGMTLRRRAKTDKTRGRIEQKKNEFDVVKKNRKKEAARSKGQERDRKR